MKQIEDGALAQLEMRLLRMQEVTGSSPVASTSKKAVNADITSIYSFFHHHLNNKNQQSR